MAFSARQAASVARGKWQGYRGVERKNSAKRHFW